jgi:UDP-galactopyranose mutase
MKKNLLLYNKYKELADKEDNLYFIRRLASNKYFNMNQVILNILDFFDNYNNYFLLYLIFKSN